MRTRIYLLKGLMLRRIEPLITNCEFLPYQEYEIKHECLVNFVADEVQRIFSEKGGVVLVAEQQQKVVGLISCEKLDWDTNHFGIQMAKIRYLMAEGEYSEAFEVKSALLFHLLGECSPRRIQHLSIRIHTEDVSSLHALENEGFRLMDTVVIYSIDFRRNPIKQLKNECYVREFKQSDLDGLADIAIESFQKGRVAIDKFHADPFLSCEKSDELYVKWIVNSCKGLADIVFVAEIDEIPVGYITCKVYGELNEKLGTRFGTMGISGVSPSYRRRGAYTSMFNTGLRWLADRVDIVEVGTQIGNYAVQKVWSRLGFKLIRSQYTLHRSIRGES